MSQQEQIDRAERLEYLASVRDSIRRLRDLNGDEVAALEAGAAALRAQQAEGHGCKHLMTSDGVCEDCDAEVDDSSAVAGAHGCYCCRDGGCADGCRCNAKFADESEAQTITRLRKENHKLFDASLLNANTAIVNLKRAEKAEAQLTAQSERLAQMEARAVKAETSAHLGVEGDNHHNAACCPYCRPDMEKQAAQLTDLTERLAQMTAVLKWLDVQGGLGHDKHARIVAALSGDPA